MRIGHKIESAGHLREKRLAHICFIVEEVHQMPRENWSPWEKKIARQAYEEARKSAAAALVTEFQAKASEVRELEHLWPLEHWLHDRRKDFNFVFDFRYTQLPFVFAQLITRGHLRQEQLEGLSDTKMKDIRRIVSGMKQLRSEFSKQADAEC